jgi:hypothetical protein
LGQPIGSIFKGQAAQKKKKKKKKLIQFCAKQPLQFVDLWHSLEETDKSLEQPWSAQTVK